MEIFHEKIGKETDIILCSFTLDIRNSLDE